MTTPTRSLVPLERVPCPSGCSAGDEPVAEGGDVLHGVPGRFAVVRCRTCGLARTSPRPTAEGIGAYYPVSYAPYQPDGAPQRRDGTGSRLSRAMQALADRANGTMVPDVAPGAVLEIGCASGAFLDRMRADGWRTYGVELSPEAAERARARGHHVHTGRVEEMPDLPEPVDLVVGWMVLEHLHDPVGALRRLREVSRPGAWCAFSVPDFSAAGRRLFGEDWILLDVPRHLFHFEPRTVADVLRRAGWKPVRVVRITAASFALESLGHVVARRGWSRAARWFQDVAENRRQRPLRRAAGLALGIARQSGAMVVQGRFA